MLKMGIHLRTVFLLPLLLDSTFNVFAQELKYYDEGVYVSSEPPYNEAPKYSDEERVPTDDVLYSDVSKYQEGGNVLAEVVPYPEVPRYEGGDSVLTKEPLYPGDPKYEAEGSVFSEAEVPKYEEENDLVPEVNPYKDISKIEGSDSSLTPDNPYPEIPKDVEEGGVLPGDNPYPEVPKDEGEGSVLPEDPEVNPEPDAGLQPEEGSEPVDNDGEPNVNGTENVPDEPEENPDACSFPGLDDFTDKLLDNLRPLVPDPVNLPDRKKGPFQIRWFTLEGVSYFSRMDYPELTCSEENGILLRVHVFWEKPLVGTFELSASNRLKLPVKAILEGLEAEAVLEFLVDESPSYYMVHVKTIRFTHSDGLRVFTKNPGHFRRQVANKLGNWLANFFQARIRSFLSRQFQELLDKNMLRLTVNTTK